MTNTYLVGGAVRDFLMGRAVHDHDYVVVGSTPEEMLAQGFKQVGADFPVFLHPENGDEYALARRERKVGAGYNGFETDHSADVTLEEDLSRRDLTVNAMAKQGTLRDGGAWVDPFNGMQDVKNKVLRHVGPAFAEDPVRVLRLARFRARFGPEWTVAPETVELVHKMAKSGVLDELTAERVWKEMSRALMEPFPRLFFDTLLQTDSLKAVFPEVYKLRRALESHRWHPEGDAYEHTMLVLTQAQRMGGNLDVRYAALVHDLGKGSTPCQCLPSHHGHEVVGVPVVRDFSNQYTVPAKLRERAMKTTRYHMHMHRLADMNPKTYVKMFDDMRALNDPYVVALLHDVGVCDHRGRLGSENEPVEHLAFVLTAYEAYASVRFADVFPNGETNVNKVRQGLQQARVRAVAEAKREWFS